jgi:16S rRNA (uracil1498-N3)-methyltransferase
MDKDETFKLPRLYTEYPLNHKGVIPLTSGQAHYLHNVLRRKTGDAVRLFDGVNGEWLGNIDKLDKKNGQVGLTEKIAEQPSGQNRVHLLFCPIKKHRMDWLIEKAVELGVTDFHPILTQNTEVRKINEERIRQQIFEAAEQCERFEIPLLHEIEKLDKVLSEWPETIEILSCLERYDAERIQPVMHDIAILIGPEGGFTREEKEKIAFKTTPVSLGETVLRCETAVVKALVLLSA